MSKKKYRIVYESKFYDAQEIMEILKKCPPDTFFKLYHKYRKELRPSMNNNQTTLNKVVKMMNDNFKKLDAKMDASFKRIDNRIDNLEKDINTRLDGIDARLDYIVKANNLKDSK